MSIDQRFQEFHRANPQIYNALREQALRWKARGANRLSAKALYEFTRMTHWLSTTTGEPWAMNNDFTSRYARRLMAEVPELRGMFELREIKEGEAPLIQYEPRTAEQEEYLALLDAV